MKLFGTLFPFVESGDESLRLGRYVANYEFLTALLNFSTFDSFHLYCLTPKHFKDTVNRLSHDPEISDSAKEKVQLFLFDVLEQNLADFEYHCFHLGGWGYFWAGTVALRNRFAKIMFPVTGVIHSLNSTDTVADAYKLARSPHTAADGVICTSDSGREVLKKAMMCATGDSDPFRGDLSVIPLGYDSRFDSMPSKESARLQLGFASDDIILLYLGRLSPSTKADLFPLLQVFKTLVDRHGNHLKLVLAGGVNPPELRLHKDMIHDLGLDQQVRLMINFETSVKSSVYASADISVAPSDNIQETFGISIIESMASGIPVVASDFDGYRELVEHGVTGLKVPTIWIDTHPLEQQHELLDSGSLQLLLAQSMVVVPSELERSLEKLILNPELRCSMGIQGKKRAFSEYRWEKVIAQYENLWEQLFQKMQTLPRPSDFETPFAPQFTHLFSHYPTRTLNDKMSVVIRPEGITLLNGGKFPSIYSDMPLILDQQVIADILEEIVSSSCTVGKLSSILHPKFRTTLLWMAKYDLVELV